MGDQVELNLRARLMAAEEALLAHKWYVVAGSVAGFLLGVFAGKVL